MRRYSSEMRLNFYICKLKILLNYALWLLICFALKYWGDILTKRGRISPYIYKSKMKRYSFIMSWHSLFILLSNNEEIFFQNRVDSLHLSTYLKWRDIPSLWGGTLHLFPSWIMKIFFQYDVEPLHIYAVAVHSCHFWG